MSRTDTIDDPLYRHLQANGKLQFKGHSGKTFFAAMVCTSRWPKLLLIAAQKRYVNILDADYSEWIDAAKLRDWLDTIQETAIQV